MRETAEQRAERVEAEREAAKQWQKIIDDGVDHAIDKRLSLDPEEEALKDGWPMGESIEFYQSLSERLFEMLAANSEEVRVSLAEKNRRDQKPAGQG